MELTEKERLKQCYLEMYRCMVDKDTKGLAKILDGSFVLVHMTGMRQNKKEFLSYISMGKLRYYAAQLENIFIEDDIQPILVGQSKVDASVFVGGSRHIWSLQLTMKMIKNNNQWLITEAVASTY
ncbi:nuclear transport factor 2 family protein [Lacrimispora amygdalina]|uniref:nuclear transport factor 2 family protein n=1 Tax=Lacrimispora amygdalina TaxID=253257 RepID=UPI000BE27341|nr:nuclear transport factor 2 family protein [Lacrimispora amygdalina]